MVFVQNYRYLSLDRNFVNILCDALCKFSSFAVCSVEVEKENGCHIYIFFKMAIN